MWFVGAYKKFFRISSKQVGLAILIYLSGQNVFLEVACREILDFKLCPPKNIAY